VKRRLAQSGLGVKFNLLKDKCNFEWTVSALVTLMADLPARSNV
jgi:hypothetical protein